MIVQDVRPTPNVFLPIRNGDGAILKRGTGVTTFTRATVSSTFNSTGLVAALASGELAYCFNPGTLDYLGLLVSNQYTNSCLQSEVFSNAYWTKTNVTADNTALAVAPDGNTTAEKLIETTATGTHMAKRATDISAATIIILSCFVKKGNGRNWVYLYRKNLDASTAYCYFDLDNGVTGTTTNWANPYIKSLPNSWYHISARFTSAASGSGSEWGVGIAEADNDNSMTGDTANFIYAWGYQVAQGEEGTLQYLPTTSGTVTKNADAFSFPVSGNLGTNNITVFVDCTVVNQGNDSTVDDAEVWVSQQDSDNRLEVLIDDGVNIDLQKRIAATSRTGRITPLTFTTFGRYKIIGRISSSTGVSVFVNGTKGGTVNTNTQNAVLGTTVQFGTGGDGGGSGGVAVKDFMIWNEAKTDAFCQWMTR